VIAYKTIQPLPFDPVVALFASVDWSSALKPDRLVQALNQSHTVITAWDGEILVGLGSAISDGCMVAYVPYMVVLPEYQGCGIGTEITRRLIERYDGFHQLALIADGRAVDFYKRMGFVPAGSCEALWIYAGAEHA